MSGIKHDNGKTDMGLLFREVPYALEEVGKALEMGSEKYGVGNWLKVEDGNSRYLSALVRHLTAYYKGETKDPESGLSHLAHVAVNALFILDLETQHEAEANPGGGNAGVPGVQRRTSGLEEETLRQSVCRNHCGKPEQERIQRDLFQKQQIYNI